MNKPAAVTTIIVACGIISLIFGLYILFFTPTTTIEATSRTDVNTLNSSITWSVFGGVLTVVGIILSIYGVSFVFRDSIKSPNYR